MHHQFPPDGQARLPYPAFSHLPLLAGEGAILSRGGASVLSGILLGLSAPGIGWWPLAWVGLVPAIWAFRKARTRHEALGQGLLLGGCYHLILLSWFQGLHPLTWMGLTPLASSLVTFGAYGLAVLLQAVGVGLIWGTCFGLLRQRPSWLPWGMPLIWVGGLWLYNQNPLGLPWGFLAYSQAEVPWIRESTYALTFWGLEGLIVWVNGAMAQVLITRHWRAVVPIGITMLLIGLSRWHLPPPSPIPAQTSVLVIQGNRSIEAERDDPAGSDRHGTYQRLITQAMRTGAPPRWVVLPEGVHQEGDPPFTVPAPTRVLTGAVYRRHGALTNGVRMFQADQPLGAFGKRILVPFGETTPLLPEAWLERGLARLGIVYRTGFQPAPHDQPLLEADGLRIGPLICFEAIYPTLAARYRHARANVIVTVSNLGWYHQHPFLEAQFLAINQFRAAEAGLPLILATNTGVSAVISERGDILSRSPSGRAAWLRYPDRRRYDDLLGPAPTSPSVGRIR